MDVVNALNSSNFILPAGDVKIGPSDYYVYSNSLVKNIPGPGQRTVKDRWARAGCRWATSARLRTPVNCNTTSCASTVRNRPIIPIMKSGGDSNTIQVVDDVRELTAHLFDLPKQLVTDIVFDQSVFVKQALEHGSARGPDRPGC